MQARALLQAAELQQQHLQQISSNLPQHLPGTCPAPAAGASTAAHQQQSLQSAAGKQPGAAGTAAVGARGATSTAAAADDARGERLLSTCFQTASAAAVGACERHSGLRSGYGSCARQQQPCSRSCVGCHHLNPATYRSCADYSIASCFTAGSKAADKQRKAGAAAARPAPAAAPRWYVTAAELASVPSYIKGRLTLEKVRLLTFVCILYLAELHASH
jgi:hypothetical protein